MATATQTATVESTLLIEKAYCQFRPCSWVKEKNATLDDARNHALKTGHDATYSRQQFTEFHNGERVA